MNKTINYKGFKLVPATKKNCEKYSIYNDFNTDNEYLIIDKETDEFEYSMETLELCKEWINA